MLSIDRDKRCVSRLGNTNFYEAAERQAMGKGDLGRTVRHYEENHKEGLGS